jgi:hypothetical protein
MENIQKRLLWRTPLGEGRCSFMDADLKPARVNVALHLATSLSSWATRTLTLDIIVLGVIQGT